MLDVSDPWGTTWHHQSPYDAGTPVTPSAPDPPEGSRSRLSSINAPPGRHKTVTPSPLSQSTSALHLQVQEPTAHTVPRKLSKRRKPVLGSLFHSESNQPADDGPPSANAGLNGLPRRHSTIAPTVPPYASSAALSIQSTTTKAERRGSVLGRLRKSRR
ncbi:hypothetical protein CONPUDRAFT_79108 [Coniophora puteana RWD-64-598 SS2]|uniref:Uncharacterized protein n=1 Tax=Coniophora puteana (strain RWD-64-598) TaxID=741705 RepID=A0A5M3N746_CONPW|nr:uncharacterized protein CONPUDRAFT_79108 [Coniophora puteana RWD-64-598 SS2]EIW86904.1 hypothetical protein CONPUDRAFT_79108 [Coniophora puteana RWD-64-598 SS2]